MSDRSIRVLCVDDHPLMREGITTMIRHEPDMVVVAESSTGQEALQSFRKFSPDITLMDLRLPDMNGIDALVAIRSEAPNPRCR